MTAEVLRHLVTVAVSITAAVLVVRQCRKPAGWLGRLIARNMNSRHSRLTDWGLKHVRIEKQFAMLDVGCGGGRTIDKLAAIASNGKVSGIDYSAASVDVARRTNSRWIEKGRVEVQQGTVSRLPFPDRAFDLVTAVETHYYWPDPAKDMEEIRRVLKPGGRLAIIAETYKGRRLDWIYRPAMLLLRATYLSVSEHRDLLLAAGFAEAEVFEERDKGWICAVGRKSSDPKA